MNANQLTNEVGNLHERLVNATKEIDKLHIVMKEMRHELHQLQIDKSRLEERLSSYDNLRDQVQAIRIEKSSLEQRLTDHIAHVEKWDNRRWGTVGLLIGGLITLVANLILAFTRK
jgi:regulator of replication initiation timing